MLYSTAWNGNPTRAVRINPNKMGHNGCVIPKLQKGELIMQNQNYNQNKQNDKQNKQNNQNKNQNDQNKQNNNQYEQKKNER